MALNIDVSQGISNEMIRPLETMRSLLQQNLRKQLEGNYYSRDYFGRVKPISGNDFGGVHPKLYTGSLFQSTTVGVSVEGEGQSRYLQFVVDFGDAYYWYYVDQGRRPGVEYEKVKRSVKQGRDARGRFKKKPTYKSYTKMPPLKDIQVWVETKPALVSNELSTETRTYLAMRSIARDGIYGINFVQNAIDETAQDLAFAGGQFISDWFQQTIENIPIIKQGKTKLYDLGSIGI